MNVKAAKSEAYLDIVWRQFRKNRAALVSLWLLVPQASSGLPMLDGHPIPVLSSAEWLRLTEAWLTNAHRAGTAAT